MALRFLLSVLLCSHAVLANVEKFGFAAPPKSPKDAVQRPAFDDYGLLVLTPENWTLRTQIETEFPTESNALGKTHWMLLEGLSPGLRYDARVIWSSTQPSLYRMNTYTLSTVLDDPELLESLQQYSVSQKEFYIRQGLLEQAVTTRSSPGLMGSIALLRIYARADYITTNVTLAKNIPPVWIDVVLDEHVRGLIPRSLIPVVAYITVVVVVSFFLGLRVAAWIQRVIAHGVPDRKYK